MFSQLIHQNSMIVNMLTTFINKLTNSWLPLCV